MLRSFGGRMIQTLLSVVLMAFPALVILGGICDLVSYRIPNAVSLALLAAFAPAAGLALAAGVGPATLGLDLGVGAAALALGVALFAAGWIGGGDAKLLAAGALWIGWPGVETYLAVTGLAGGALALMLLAMRSAALRPLALAGPGWVAKLAEPGGGAPYGVAIAFGALAAFPLSALARAAHAG
jgi:prepilin peptidase CpaA